MIFLKQEYQFFVDALVLLVEITKVTNDFKALKILGDLKGSWRFLFFLSKMLFFEQKNVAF